MTSALSGPVALLQTAPGVIPYRTSAPISATSFVLALTLTALVMIALIGTVIYARKRGWLRMAGVGQPIEKDRTSVELRASQRVSMATTVHVVAYRDHEYLIVESARGCTTRVSPMGALVEKDKVL